MGALVREYGVTMPTIHVRYEGVTVQVCAAGLGWVRSRTHAHPYHHSTHHRNDTMQTEALVGSAGIPTVGNAFKRLVQASSEN